jgi:hypothetical protein
MRQIQVDMFEVQLGAAVLLQFKTDTRKTVRVLADAGVTAAGYPLGHVHKKLPSAFTAFDGDAQRLDLIIGTHYDADHLEGLVPIIEDERIDIGEAWMPPVANDTEMHAMEESIQERHLLGHQLAGGEGTRGHRVLGDYLRAKADVCEQLQDLELTADKKHLNTRKVPREQHDFSGLWKRRVERGLKYFEAHIRDANNTLGQSEHTHADEDMEALPSAEAKRKAMPGPDVPDALFRRLQTGWSDGQRREFFRRSWSVNSGTAKAQAWSMAYIRRAAAKDAINAISLYKVVNALKARNIPISYHLIQDGRPRRFVWKVHRFVPGTLLKTDGPELTLLGPSEGLVKKHWNKLPLGDYLAKLSFISIPVKSITTSNQLSYVARFSSHDQSLLVCGDAGCVDFKPSRGGYYKQLIDALLPLHIIQIAHHGGNNAHFYNVLLEAGYPEQTDPSLLLLSHATDDKFRPSKEFGLFIEQLRKEREDIKLLFTSRPRADKVKEYEQIIHPVVGKIGDVGDIRIEFVGKKWNVLSHAVRIVEDLALR